MIFGKKRSKYIDLSARKTTKKVIAKNKMLRKKTKKIKKNIKKRTRKKRQAMVMYY